MCDCLVALPGATSGRSTLFAKNSDRPVDEPQDVAWYPPRRDLGSLRATHITIEPFAGETLGCVLSRPRWCWGAEHGVNEAGVAIGNEAIYTTLDPRSAEPALIGMDLVRLGLERSTSAEEAVDTITALLEGYGQGGTGHDPAIGSKPYWSSFLVADSTNAWIVETSGRRWQAERVEAAAAISNRTTIPAFDAEHRHPRQATERFVDARLAAGRAVLADRPVTVPALFRHLRSHDSSAPGEPGWSVCMHADGVESTTASMVAELVGGGRPSRAWLLLGSPCRSIYVPISVGEDFIAPPWERFAALGRRIEAGNDNLAESLRELEVWLAAECPPSSDAWHEVDRFLAAHGL